MNEGPKGLYIENVSLACCHKTKKMGVTNKPVELLYLNLKLLGV